MEGRGLRGKDKNPRKREGYKLHWANYRATACQKRIMELNIKHNNQLKDLRQQHQDRFELVKLVLERDFGINWGEFSEALLEEEMELKMWEHLDSVWEDLQNSEAQSESINNKPM